jgi:hypothetical protein
VDTNAMDLWFERLMKPLEGYEAHDIYTADEMVLLFQLPARSNAGTERRDLPCREIVKE